MSLAEGRKTSVRSAEQEEGGQHEAQKRRRLSTAHDASATRSSGVSASIPSASLSLVPEASTLLARETRAASVESTLSSLSSLSEPGFDSQEARAAVTAAQAAQNAESINFPKFDPARNGKGKHWPAECELALVQYIARNATLKSWAASGTTSGTLINILQRFSDLTQGAGAPSVHRKAIRLRDHYSHFRKDLKDVSKATPTKDWNDAEDLRLLEKHEAQHRSKWLRIWHDDITLEAQSTFTPTIQSKAAAQVANGVEESQDGARNASVGGPVAPQAQSSPAEPQPSSGLSNSGESLEASATLTAQNILAINTTSISASSSSEDAPHGLVTRTNSQLFSVPAQLKQQAGLIKELQEQGNRQNTLLAQQAKLLKRQAVQAERQAEQAEQQASVIEEQATQLTRQSYTLENVKQQLEALHALLVRQFT